MGFKCGIIGLPNVGKSTLFNALTRSRAAQAANYPFCTIDPNVGIVEVPDPRLLNLTKVVSPKKTIPAVIKFIDIAGLVSGAAEGEGLGNRFLSHIREVDAIAHVVRAFDDNNVTHVYNHVSPASDIEAINTELILADIASSEKAIQRVEKVSKYGNKVQRALKELLAEVQTHLNTGKMIRSADLTEDQVDTLKPLCFLTVKPTLYIANVSEDGFQNNPYLDQIVNISTQENAEVVAICAPIEQELSELKYQEAKLFLDEMGLEEPGLNRLIRVGYQLLGLQTYFTAGEKEVRAWTVRVGITAQQAAGIIHTDFEKGFIRAETITYSDYIKYHGEQGAKEAGKLLLQGKEYVVQDGDIMHFRFNI